MQDSYAGDVGDFGKYALLNRLCIGDGNGQRELSLGVLWYVPDAEPEPSNDGKHIGYLQPPKCRKFRHCDPDLWDKMHQMVVVDGDRSIATVERSGALPAGTKYYSEPLFCQRHESQATKKERRRTWLKASRDAVKSADLVFVEPDNGFQSKGVKPHYKKGPKYVYYCDLDAHIELGQSLVVYHHLGRQKCKQHPAQISDLLDTLNKRFDLEQSVFALHYRRGTGRAYFVLPNPSHSELLADRAQQLIDSCWGKCEHFEQCIYKSHPK